jgi:hypothetical protein
MTRTALALLLVLAPACAVNSSPMADESAAADTSAAARHVHLATEFDEQQIDITYATATNVVDGDSETDVGTGLSIQVRGLEDATQSVRVVLVDDCSEFGRPLFQIVSQCDLKVVRYETWGVKVSAGACTQLTHPDNVDTAFPDVLVARRTRAGDDIACSQQIAVVADGEWLTDPISKSHNFEFELQRAR